MATHSSALALKIPWMEELGAGYCPWGSKESGTTERIHFLSFTNLVTFPALIKGGNKLSCEEIAHNINITTA